MARSAGLATAGVVMVMAAAVALSAEPGFLGADDLKALITGKTIEVGDSSGTTFRVYFDADGNRFSLQQDGSEYALPWRVLPDGTHCVSTGTGDDCARVIRNGDGTYTRYRDGSAVNRWLQILPGKTLVAVPTPGIYTRQTGPDTYMVLVAGPTVTERQARQQATAVAGTLCKALVPVLGEFRFESTEKVGAADAGDGSRTFQFRQQVSCVAGTRESPAERRPTLKSAEESRQIQDQIRGKTEEYFRLLAANRMDEVFAEVDARAMGQDAATWKQSRRSFQAMAGEPVRINVVKITVYDNPADARNPGLHVAADYVNEYRNVPVHCGYLIWFRPIGGEFRISREETGHITAEQLKSIPPEQLPAIKQGLRCIAP